MQSTGDACSVQVSKLDPKGRRRQGNDKGRPRKMVMKAETDGHGLVEAGWFFVGGAPYQNFGR